MSDLSFLGGWYDGTDLACGDGGHVAIGADIPTFRDAAPGLMLGSEPSQPILLYRAVYDVVGKYLPYAAQQIGSCVGHGHAHALDCLQCIEIALGEQSEFRETSAEFVYAASRKAGNILGPFDGSYGSAAVKSLVNYGACSREMLGSDGINSGSLAKKWGRTGPPQQYLEMAGSFKLGAVVKVTDNQSAISLLWNGYPITICSNQGFVMTRDRDGYCAGSGRWAHCMHLQGYDPAKKRYLIVQSWGENSPSGPLYMDQPNYTFWADAALVERNIFRADDSWGLISAPDFVRRSLPGEWLTLAA